MSKYLMVGFASPTLHRLFFKIMAQIKLYPQLFCFSLFCVIIISGTQATAKSRLSIQTPAAVLPGKPFKVDLLIKDIQPVYGVELALRFDPDILEVIDADTEEPDIQVEAGKFFDIRQNHFVLQNKANNTEGAIGYAMSLLNPAPAAQGEGTLARITFKGKTTGKTAISIAKAKFGTRDGKAIIPEIEIPEHIQLGIKPAEAKPTPSPKTASESQLSLKILAPVLIGIAVFAVLIIWVMRRRKKRNR